jgi:Zn-dependent protease with chaperone function
MRGYSVIYRFTSFLLLFLMITPTGLEARYIAKPRMSILSLDDEIQLGKQNADEVLKTMPLVTDPELNRYVQELGSKLVGHAPGNKYPYNFHIVNQKEINAFALPGGPVFINLGTIQAADREDELAGVMAHEISHVVMRHSANMVTKQMIAQVGVSLLEGTVGKNGGLLSKIAEAGIGLGINSLFLKYSRDMETEADKVGTGVMYDSGYNPQGMVDLFKKLEGVYGNSSTQFFLDHPNPGNRAEYVGKEIKTLGVKQYLTDSSEFSRVKMIVTNMKPLTATEVAAWQKAHPSGNGGSTSTQPASTPTPADTGTGATPGTIDPASILPSGILVPYENELYAIQRPENWDVLGDASSGVTIAPKVAISQNAVAFGMINSTFTPSKRLTLDKAVEELIAQIQKDNPQMRKAGTDQIIRVHGLPAKSVSLYGPSPLQDEKNTPLREHDQLVAVLKTDGTLTYFIFIAPEREWSKFNPTFQQMIKSLRVK